MASASAINSRMVRACGRSSPFSSRTFTGISGSSRPTCEGNFMCGCASDLNGVSFGNQLKNGSSLRKKFAFFVQNFHGNIRQLAAHLRRELHVRLRFRSEWRQLRQSTQEWFEPAEEVRLFRPELSREYPAARGPPAKGTSCAAALQI